MRLDFISAADLRFFKIPLISKEEYDIDDLLIQQIRESNKFLNIGPYLSELKRHTSILIRK